MTSVVSVKAVQGRIAREGPNGPFIPDDRYVNVENTPYMKRLINVHGDVVVEPPATIKPAGPKKSPAKPKPPASAENKEDS